MRIKRIPKKVLVKRADEIFSLYIRLRDKRAIGHCHLCPKPIECVSHLFTRSTHALRWDERASFGSCFGHNNQHEYRPEVYTHWFIQKYGGELYSQLYYIHHEAKKVEREAVEAIIVDLKAKMAGE